MPDDKKNRQSTLRLIPSVDQLIRTPEAAAIAASIGIRRLTAIARLVTSEMRAGVLDSTDASSSSANGDTAESFLEEAIRRVHLACDTEQQSGLKSVINASGVILHTNLGRAPLSEAACKAMIDEAARYCTLEYDSLTGTRGK